MPQESDVSKFNVSYGRPDQSSNVLTDEPEEQEPNYVTTEQLRAELDRIKQESLSAAQSLIDKADNRLGKRMQQLIDRRRELEAQGQQVSDAAFNKLLEEERLKVIAQGDQPDQVGAPEIPDEVAEVNRLAGKMLEDMGVSLEEDDPEAEYVKFDNPQVFLTTLKIAAELKQKRVGTENQQINTHAEARVNLAGKQSAANPIADITDPSTLLDMAWKNKKR